MPDGVVVVDADGRITYANPAAERLAGAGQDELVGRALDDAVPLRDAAGNLVDVLGAAAPPGVRRVPVASSTWSPSASFKISLTAAFLRDGARRGRPGGVRARRLRPQPGRQPARRAHQHPRPRAALPLTSVKGFTSTLLRRWERFTDDQKQEMLATVQHGRRPGHPAHPRAARRLRIDAGRLGTAPQEFDLAAMAEGIVGRFELQHDGHKFQLSFPEEFPRVYADPDKIEQVLTNLVENAVKYSDGGAVTVTGQVTDTEVEVAVRDQGVGIAGPAPLIFTKFYRRAGTGASGAPSGTGLGLFIARSWSRPTTAASGPTRHPTTAPPCDFACPAGAWSWPASPWPGTRPERGDREADVTRSERVPTRSLHANPRP